MMRYDYVDLYIYMYVLYDDSYKSFNPGYMGFHSRFYGDDYIATKPLWTDLWKGRIWLDGRYDVPRSGWCGWRFNHNRFGA